MTPISPEDLYHQFLELQEQHQRIKKSDPEELLYYTFELADEFEALVVAHLKVIANLKSKSLSEDDYNICEKLEVMLKGEINTWRLAKAIFKDQQQNDLFANNDSNIMDDDNNDENIDSEPILSEDQIIGDFYMRDHETRLMQLVTDWLEANEADDLDYKHENGKVEFYSEGPVAWENTFHAMRAKYNTNIPDLDITINPNTGSELCDAMDPDASIRTKKALAHSDKEVEIRLFKHLFRFIKAGRLHEGQELAQRVGYHWLSAILDGWLLFSDPNLDDENMGRLVVHQPSDVKPISGNKKRDVFKQTCFKAAKMHGLSSYEKALLGVFGGNLKSVLPVCNTWSDQLWARLKCSIEVKIEEALRNPKINPQKNRNRPLVDYPQEFYDNYQDIEGIFKSIREQKIVSSFKEQTIHQTVQKHLILNDIEGLLIQLVDWTTSLDYDNNLADHNQAVSPQFLRFFAHIVLFLRELNLVSADNPSGTKIIESYIQLLIRHRSIESVAYYTVFLPKQNQVTSYSKLLATISDREERKHCLKIAKDSNLDVDEISQTVVELIRDEPIPPGYGPSVTISGEVDSTKTTPSDKKKIDALDYLLYLETKNYVAILHHGNILLRLFALQRKMDAVKETFLRLPADLKESVEKQWRIQTNNDITISLRNNLRELEGFRILLEAQEELTQWSELNHKKPEEPRKPTNLSRFCDNVNYEQRLKQYQQDISLWKADREVRTNSLTGKITELFTLHGGWMKDLAKSPTKTDEIPQNDNRFDQMSKLRKIYVPHLVTVCFNVLFLTQRYEDCLKVTHILAEENLKLYEEYSKAQLREFLDKIVDVTKKLVIQSSTR